MFSRWLTKAQSGRREATYCPSPLGADRDSPISSLDALADEALAARLVAGEHQALAVLFERHGSLVYRIARRVLRNDGEAEEAVQQVFLDAYRAIANFDPQKGSFKVWLLQYAYTRTINRRTHLKSQRFYNWEALDTDLAIMDRYDRRLQLTQLELGHLVAELFKNLKPLQKRVIELTYFEGLTAEEISKITGETASKVRHALYRGMTQLRTALQNSNTSEQPKQKSQERKAIVYAFEPREL